MSWHESSLTLVMLLLLLHSQTAAAHSPDSKSAFADSAQHRRDGHTAPAANSRSRVMLSPLSNELDSMQNAASHGAPFLTGQPLLPIARRGSRTSPSGRGSGSALYTAEQLNKEIPPELPSPPAARRLDSVGILSGTGSLHHHFNFDDSRNASLDTWIEVSRLLDAANHVDVRISTVASEIFYTTPRARMSVEQDIASSNRNKLILGAANFFGMVFGIANGAGDTLDFTNLTQGQQLFVTAQALYGYGYWGPFLLDFEEPRLQCGVENLQPVLDRYSVLTRDLALSFGFIGDYLDDVTGIGRPSSRWSDGEEYAARGATFDASPTEPHTPRFRLPGGQSNVDGALDPLVLQYYAVELNHAIKRALFCITSRQSSNQLALETSILTDLYTELIQERLQLTADAIDLLVQHSRTPPA